MTSMARALQNISNKQPNPNTEYARLRNECDQFKGKCKHLEEQNTKLKEQIETLKKEKELQEKQQIENKRKVTEEKKKEKESAWCSKKEWEKKNSENKRLILQKKLEEDNSDKYFNRIFNFFPPKFGDYNFKVQYAHHSNNPKKLDQLKDEIQSVFYCNKDDKSRNVYLYPSPLKFWISETKEDRKLLQDTFGTDFYSRATSTIKSVCKKFGDDRYFNRTNRLYVIRDCLYENFSNLDPNFSQLLVFDKFLFQLPDGKNLLKLAKQNMDNDKFIAKLETIVQESYSTWHDITNKLLSFVFFKLPSPIQRDSDLYVKVTDVIANRLEVCLSFLSPKPERQVGLDTISRQTKSSLNNTFKKGVNSSYKAYESELFEKKLMIPLPTSKNHLEFLKCYSQACIDVHNNTFESTKNLKAKLELLKLVSDITQLRLSALHNHAEKADVPHFQVIISLFALQASVLASIWDEVHDYGFSSYPQTTNIYYIRESYRKLWHDMGKEI